MTSQGFDEPVGAADGPEAAAVDEVAQYAGEVRAELADLSADESAELLEDLEDHLREVAAEDAGVLRERLGAPVVYAAELRESAGLPPRGSAGAGAVGSGSNRRDPRRSVLELIDTAERRARANRFGAEALAFLPTLRPAWWVLRAWVAVRFLEVITGGDTESPLPIIPRVGRSALLGTLFLLGAIAVSVWFGRHRRPLGWRRALLASGQTALVLFALLTVAKSDDTRSVYGGAISSAMQSQSGLAEDGRPVTNIAAYDRDGKLLTGVYLYDQDGKPLRAADHDQYGYMNGGVYAPATWLDADGVFIDNMYPREAQVRIQGNTGPKLVPVPGAATSRAVPKAVTHVPGGPEECPVSMVIFADGESRLACQGRVGSSSPGGNPGTTATPTATSSPTSSPTSSATPAQPGATAAPSASTGSTPPSIPAPSTSSP